MQNIQNITTLVLLSIMALFVPLILAMNAFADNDSVVDQVSITVPMACTISGNGMSSHTTSIPNGTYTDDIGTTTLKAFCNDNSGFAIYAVGYTGNEIGATNSTKLVGTSASNNATIDTGTATGPVSGNDTSNWAMKLQTVSSPTPTYPITIDNSFSNYSAVPSSYTKVAHRDNGTDIGTNAEGSTLTTTYAAYISKTQAADTYTGQVKYTLVHPSDATAPLPPPSPPASCPTPVPNLTYMQGLNNTNKAQVLQNMIEDQQYFLKDERDEKIYCVAKLKDGNIWMTQNLDHDIVTDGTVIYDNTTTDIGWNTLTSSYDTASWIPVSSTKTTSDTSWDISSTGSTTPASYDPGDLYTNEDAMNGWKYYNSCDAGSCDATTYAELNSDWKTFFDSCDAGTTDNCNNSLMPTNNPSQDGIQQYKLGNYYNWSAAVAKNNTSTNTTKYQDLDQSICPAGWTLPKNGDNTSKGSVIYLIDQYGWDGIVLDGYTPYESPLYFIPAGNWRGSLSSVNIEGVWWSSVVNSSSYAYYHSAGVDGGIIPVISGTSRNYGLPLRCVSR